MISAFNLIFKYFYYFIDLSFKLYVIFKNVFVDDLIISKHFLNFLIIYNKIKNRKYFLYLNLIYYKANVFFCLHFEIKILVLFIHGYV